MHPDEFFTAWKLPHKRVFLRADLNVGINNGSVILATHIDRPDGYNASFSTKILMDWFITRGYHITFIAYDPAGYPLPQSYQPGHVYLLDNLRFYRGEIDCDIEFAKKLRNCADFYINEAFGIAHEFSATTTILPELFGRKERSIGFLMRSELVHLSFLKRKEKRLTVLLGGGKGSDKIPYLVSLINRPQVTLLLGPAIAYTFLKAQGYPVGKSLVNDAMLETAAKVIQLAQEHNHPVVLPTDSISRTSITDHTLITHPINEFPPDAVGVTIGPETTRRFKAYVENTDMVFVNGAIGFTDQPETLNPGNELYQTIGHANGYRIAGGGDTIQRIRRLGIQHTLDFCSTGGGAALAFVSDHTLPGLAYYVN